MSDALPELVSPLDHWPAEWQLTSNRPLDGEVHVAFTRSAVQPTPADQWWPGVWVGTDPTATARVVQLMVAGSAAAGQGAHPGVGDYTAWLRYTDGDGSVRVRGGGLLRFR